MPSSGGGGRVYRVFRVFIGYYRPVRFGGSADVPQHLAKYQEQSPSPISVQSFAETSAERRNIMTIDSFAKIYDDAPGFIAATEGADHRFTYANKSYCDLVGCSDLVGKPVAAALPELAGQRFLPLLDQVYGTGEAFVGTNVSIRLGGGPNGEERLRYVNFICQPIRGDDGAVTGLLAQGHESTGQVLAEQRLRAYEEELSHAARVNVMGTMAATLAHELNQPLTAVAAYASAGIRILGDKNPDPALLAEALAAIQEAADRAGAIIRNIRQFTRRGETTKSVFDLKIAIEESVGLVMTGIYSKIEIAEPSPSGLLVKGNPTQIMQVMVNLLRNACEASEPGRPNSVEVAVWRGSSEAIVSVRDQGRGMSAEAAQNIFTWTSSDKEGGTGLGLAICRAILDAHEGRIWLEKADQDGCEFRFSLPLATPE